MRVSAAQFLPGRHWGTENLSFGAVARPTGGHPLFYQTSSRLIFFSQLREKIERSPSQASKVSEQTKCVGVDLQRLQARSFTFQPGRSYTLMASASHSVLLGSFSRIARRSLYASL